MGDKAQEMYFYLLILELVKTAALELFAELGVNKDEVTKEMWLEISPQLVANRKAAIDKIRAH